MKAQLFLCLIMLGKAVTGLASGALPEKLSQEQARELVNPISYTSISLKRGQLAFTQYCAACHDRDGKARSAVLTKAADLTNPASWSYGDTDGEILRTILEGAGNNMPPFKYMISSEKTVWDIVNFVHSLRLNARSVEE